MVLSSVAGRINYRKDTTTETMSNDKISREEYRDTVKYDAEAILEECEEYDNVNLQEQINVTVENHQWLIYNGYQTDILDASDTEPFDWKHRIDDDSSYYDVLRAMAYSVLRQDIAEKVNELREN